MVDLAAMEPADSVAAVIAEAVETVEMAETVLVKIVLVSDSLVRRWIGH
jgi:hypothetical protein